jgi:hypothetical protein
MNVIGPVQHPDRPVPPNDGGGFCGTREMEEPSTVPVIERTGYPDG